MTDQKDKVPEATTPVEKWFYQQVIKFFRNTEKTGWGKNEIVDKIRDLYIEHLEQR